MIGWPRLVGMERPMRSWIRRLERDARGHLESFELLNGSTFYYDRLETYGELFVHACDLQLGRGEWPKPPELYRKMCEARDPAAVLEQFRPEELERAFVNVAELYDTDVLVYERHLVPIYHPEVEDLSE